MLAQTLARLGCQTRWFTSSFDHYQKRQRLPRRQSVVPEPNLTISVLDGLGYSKNISLRRIVHNRAFARAFTVESAGATALPDVIVTDIPTTEGAAAAVAFGAKHNIPTIVSIRDLWPDFFADHAPAMARPLVRTLVAPLEMQARYACANADSIVGISDRYLDWGLAKAGRSRSEQDAVFPLGYAPARISEARAGEICSALGIAASDRVVSFVGSWGHTYDIDLVERTARALLDRPGVKFLIAGEGEQSIRMRPRLAELGNVILPGWIDAEAIAAVLQRTDIGLLPYTAMAPQGLPNKVFEYMAYGAYQLASIGGELTTFYKASGAGSPITYPNAERLAQAIRDTLADEDVLARRADRIASFNRTWDADRIYQQFASHIVAIATR
jgi:Glycosyltransferase